MSDASGSREDGREGYHYSREDRLRLGGREAPADRGGFLKKNRSLVIVLLDLIIIFIKILIFVVFFPPDPATADAGGYRYRLRAVAFEGNTLATVSIRRISNGAEERPGGIVTVTFTAEGTMLGEPVMDVLPEDFGAERMVREVIPEVPAHELVAQVRTDHTEVSLRAEVVRE